MTTFDDRQKAYEDKFAHDEELSFKAKVKAAKLFATFVAEECGLPVDAYKNEFVNLVTSGKNEDALIEKAISDSENKGKKHSKEGLSERYSQCLAKAKELILAN